MSRFFAMWLITSGMVGVFFFIFSSREKIATLKIVWRVVAALVVGAVLTALPLVLNNIQGL